MIRLVLTRVALGLVSLGVIYTLTFILVIRTPGNPFQASERQMPQEILRALQARYDIDNPARYYVQYATRLVTEFDFGPSFQYREWTVNQILRDALPVSLTLGTLAMTLAVLIGVPVGVWGAVHRNTWIDHLGLGVVLLGISVPTFVSATALLSIFAVHLKWFPVGGWGQIRHLLLPAVSLSLPFIAYIARLMRISMLDVLGEDYIRTAAAKGLPRRTLVWKHAFKNAFLPVLSYLGPAAAHALTGSFVVELVFNVPGMGTYFVQSIQNLDRGLIMAVVLVFSTILIGFNLIVDLLYAAVDPRIKLTS